MKKKDVIIIGGGFGGLSAAKVLGNSEHNITLIDKKNHHLFQPLLYQVATATLSPADISKPIREILKSYENIKVLMGCVCAIDSNKQIVELQNGDRLSFDYLIIATGSRHSYFGHSEWEPYAPGLKTLEDALTIREKILVSFEKAEMCKTVARAQQYMNFIIIGGGPTGVEMAGAIAEIVNKTMIKNFRNIDPTKTKITLIEGSSQILSVFSKKLSEKATIYLKNLNVQVLTNTMVTKITQKGVYINEKLYPSKNIIWAAGNKISGLLKLLNVPLDKIGRVLVDSDLSIPHHSNIFVIGDAAHAKNKKGDPYQGLAPVAVQQGQYIGHIISKETPKDQRKPFSYLDKGNLATIGKTKAIGMLGHLKFFGFLAWIIWCFVHILYLIGFRNRFLVLSQWIIAYFGDQRGARLIRKEIKEKNIY